MCFDAGFHWSSPAKPVLHSGRSQHAAWSIWGATGSRAPVEDTGDHPLKSKLDGNRVIETNEGTNIERKHVSHYVSFHFMRME